MRYQPAVKELFIKNRKKLTDLLPGACMAVICSGERIMRNGENPYPFRQNSDFFYLTGIDQEHSILLIWKYPGKDGWDEILFILKPDEKLETWEGKKLAPEEAQQLSGIRTIRWMDDFGSVFHKMTGSLEVIFVNAELPASDNEPRFVSERNIPDRNYPISSNKDSKGITGEPVHPAKAISLKHFPGIQFMDGRLAEQLKLIYPGRKLASLAPLMRQLRLVKEPEEIEMIRKACSVTREAFLAVLDCVRPGMKEYEAEAVITGEFIRRGAAGHAFQPIVASGANACVLHYNGNDGVCRDGDLLLMDFGAEYGNYASDCSRTIPVNGKFSERHKELYLSVLRVFRKAMLLMIPGTTIAEIQQVVCRFLEKEHVKQGLYTLQDLKNQDPASKLVNKFFPHGVSHYMGLDVHDMGEKNIKLVPGMVITCEPGIYIPSEGIGIRLENDILITENGPVDLMADIPIEPQEIENLLK